MFAADKINTLKEKLRGDWFETEFAGAKDALIDVLNSIADMVPVFIEVEDITSLTSEQLDTLNVGDRVLKITGTARHLYLVTYKDAENGGLCLTYTDAANVETVSYDHSESGWTYNSTDTTHIGG